MKFKAFLMKDYLSIIRSYKLLVILIVFAIFGFLNPIMAKLMPEILKSSGLDINLAEPTEIDAWIQFYKNISTQLALYIILFSSFFTDEIKSGSLINMVTKGISRRSVILSKYTVLVSCWVLSYYLTFSLTYFYTAILFDTKLENLILGSTLYLIYGILIITASLFGAILFKHVIGSLIVPLSFVIIFPILAMLEKFTSYLPSELSSLGLELINKSAEYSDATNAIIASLLMIATMLISSILIFNKQYLYF